MQQEQPLCGYKESDEEVSLSYFDTPIQEDDHKTVVKDGIKMVLNMRIGVIWINQVTQVHFYIYQSVVPTTVYV
jgi:hypothetical protein